MTAIQGAIKGLARLRPPVNEETRYRDFIRRTDILFGFIRSHESQLLEVAQALQKGPVQVSSYPPQSTKARAASRRFVEAERELRALGQSIVGDVRAANDDARRLGLHSCVSGINA